MMIYHLSYLKIKHGIKRLIVKFFEIQDTLGGGLAYPEFQVPQQG